MRWTALAFALLVALPVHAQTQRVSAATPTPDQAASASAAAGKTAKQKKPPSEKQLAAYDRMRKCNAQAKEQDLHGDPRKAFMKGCLSTHTTPST
jgi:hypothetical protein